MVAVWVFASVSGMPGEEEATLTVMVVVERETDDDAWRFATVRFEILDEAPFAMNPPEMYNDEDVAFVAIKFEMVVEALMS